MAPHRDPDHMPQLDSLRAIAFVAVAVSHWMPGLLVGIVPWGTGVQLFFVLSGFLITRILLRNRPADGTFSMRAVLGAFYARRFLRIFPLYYGVLAVSLLLSVGPIRETWPWHVSYLSNFHYARYGHGSPVEDPFLHFWSLAVEEQFYLVWPLLVLTIPVRALGVVLWGGVIGATFFRLGIAQLAPEVVSGRYLTPSCLDALGAGGLIAFAEYRGGEPALRRLTGTLAGVGVFGLIISTVPLPWFLAARDARAIGHTFLVIFYGAVVAAAAQGIQGVVGRLLSYPPITYLGKISYGLYVYHYFAPFAVLAVATAAGVGAPSKPYIAIPMYAAFTLAVAAASWHLYELPLNRLKRRFPYPSVSGSRSRVAPQAPSLPASQVVRVTE